MNIRFNGLHAYNFIIKLDIALNNTEELLDITKFFTVLKIKVKESIDYQYNVNRSEAFLTLAAFLIILTNSF